ncbi:YdcH family protein [Pseudoteredinibacter isoporae]|uniref:YdcH family protein n=1 Tax=Pseudoteredinibacter isoporae TaxID=570281 RepID=UPI00310A447F
MNIEKHDLVHELPEFREQIHTLKMNDRHFAKLFKEYHELDHNVRNLEQNDSPTSDEHMEELKKQRLHLKDEMFAMLQKA